MKPLLIDNTKDKAKARLLGTPGSTATREDETENARQRTSERYLALFAEDGLQLTSRLVALGGLRIERVGLEAQSGGGAPRNARSTTDVNPSLQLAFVARHDLKLHLGAGRSVTRPKFDELSPFEEEAATRLTIGNPDLQPARAWGLDAGGAYSRPGLTLGANGFHRRIRG